jgi:hypothetical protein
LFLRFFTKINTILIVIEEIEFAIAKFKYSKNDFYAVEIIERFKNYEQANKEFTQKSYENSGGGTWQDAYEYQIIDLKDNILYYHNGGKIQTILD